MLADIIANHDDIAGVILDHLDLETLVKVSKVSKMISAYDFASLLESKTVRFVHGKTYVSTPTGWHNRIYRCTITRKHVKSKTVLWQNGRRKVRMRKGVEHILIASDPKFGCIYAKDLHSPTMDAEINRANSYWSSYK